MSGPSVIGAGALATVSPEWIVVDLADFDGDGKADIIWRHTDGSVYFWKMNGASVTSSAPVVNPGGSWQIVAP
jgi:hypothetical protein